MNARDVEDDICLERWSPELGRGEPYRDSLDAIPVVVSETLAVFKKSLIVRT